MLRSGEAGSFMRKKELADAVVPIEFSAHYITIVRHCYYIRQD